VSEGALAAAAAAAPVGAGVYVFLDDRRRLLYVGKASNLRRRLQQHAKELPTHAGSKYARVRHVAWEPLADDDAACAREADLIVALQPLQNAAIAGEGRWTFLSVVPVAESAWRFSLSASAPTVHRGGRVYGCFPHLGKGMTSRPGIACSDGYAALLRVLWATGSLPPAPYPRAISGPSAPVDATVPVPVARRDALHRLLAGTSARLLDELEAVVSGDDGSVEPYLRPALARDLTRARAFFGAGPAALRRFRLRHGLAPGLVPRVAIEAGLHAELVALVGGDVVLAGASERTRRRLP
jgi:predicted GIY-YIG superfamily endonuclease